jgi:hypothetical protein
VPVLCSLCREEIEMTHWKPYRVAWRGSYHYFDLLKGAKVFIMTFEPNKAMYKTFVIEKLNKTKQANPKHTYAEIYEDYEVWVLTPKGWDVRRKRT